MTEWKKAQAGFLYDANYEADIIAKREKCADLCYEFNLCRPSDTVKQNELMHKIIGSIKGSLVITAPFYCSELCVFNSRSSHKLINKRQYFN